MGRAARGIVVATLSAVLLAGCATTAPRPRSPGAEAAVPALAGPAAPSPEQQQGLFRLPSMAADAKPVRVALLLPLSSPSADTRAVAVGLENAAEMALFDAGNPNIILMPRDDAGSPDKAAQVARDVLAQGAEIIVGPLFAQAVTAVGRVAEAQHVPVVAFSSDRSVGGNGVYLLSFQPENEVRRIVSYAARQGHTAFAAMVPETAYGAKVADAFRASVAEAGGTVTTVTQYPEDPEMVVQPAQTVSDTHPDAVLIADGGAMLRAIASALALTGAPSTTTKYLGTGLWDDPTIGREPMLVDGWYPAPAAGRWTAFVNRYQALYGGPPPRIASLAYDGISLVALLANGKPFARYTDSALVDPNGFDGIDGIFRFRDNGSAERGLAVMRVGPTSSTVLDPAPQTFQQAGF